MLHNKNYIPINFLRHFFKKIVSLVNFDRNGIWKIIQNKAHGFAPLHQLGDKQELKTTGSCFVIPVKRKISERLIYNNHAMIVINITALTELLCIVHSLICNWPLL